MDYKEQIQALEDRLRELRNEIPDTPLDAEKKALEIEMVEDQLIALYEQDKDTPDMMPAPTKDTLTEEIKSITDELMEIEIKMLRADMNNEEDERIKLQMCKSSLESRRQELISQVKEINGSKKAPSNDLEKRISALEKEVEDIKALLYQILTKN